MGDVVSFDRSRFTRGDLEEFDKFAAPLLRARVWQGVMRYAAVGRSDWIGVFRPGDERPSLNFTRQPRGPLAGAYMLYGDPHRAAYREARSLRALLDSVGERGDGATVGVALKDARS